MRTVTWGAPRKSPFYTLCSTLVHANLLSHARRVAPFIKMIKNTSHVPQASHRYTAALPEVRQAPQQSRGGNQWQLWAGEEVVISRQICSPSRLGYGLGVGLRNSPGPGWCTGIFHKEAWRWRSVPGREL